MKTSIPSLLAAVGALLFADLSFAQVPTVQVSTTGRITDLAQNPNSLDTGTNQTLTGKPAVLTPTSLTLSNAFGTGTIAADAVGQAGFLRCRSAAGYAYFVSSITQGGYASASAHVQVDDYLTATSSTLASGTVVTFSIKMSLKGAVSAPSADQARPGITADMFAVIRAQTSVDDQIGSASFPIHPLADLTFDVNAKVGETFPLRYELDAGTYLASIIPDYRSLLSDFYTADNGAVVTVTPKDPDNAGFTALSGYNYGWMQVPPVTPTAGPVPFVSETPAELAGPLDADGDGLLDFLVVDKATGVRRLGFQQSNGSFQWADPASTGLDNVTGLGIGRFADATAADGFAVAAPLWNRVVVFPDAAGDSTVAPAVGIGPSVVVGFNFAGDTRDDLAIGTIWDKSTAPVHLSGLVSDSTGWSPVYGPHEEAGALSRGNRARFSEERPWMLGALRDATGGKEFVTRPIFGFPGFADGPTLARLPADTEWAWGQFKTNDLARFMFYSPGTSNLYVPALQEPTPYQFSWSTGTTYSFDLPISRVTVLPLKTGSLLLIVFGDGTAAATFDFDGNQAPTLRQTLTATGGTSFSIGGALANGDFLLLSGPSGPGGASTAWQHWGFDGTQHKLVSSGPLPSLTVSQGRANVLLFASNPDLDPGTPLLGTLRVGEWSDQASLAGGKVHVTGEQFLGPALGLGSPGASDVTVAPSVLFAAVNQHAVPDSMSVFEPPTPAVFADLSFSPPSGTYHPTAGSYLLVRILSAAGGPVQYRTGPTQPWILYDSANSIRLSGSATIQAFVDTTLPGPIRSATYAMADAPAIAVTPPVFSNNNGLPDSWAQAFGLTDPQGDPDGDGFTNLQEFLAGTDPLDPSSVPGNYLSQVVVAARLPGPDAPAGTICEIAWPASVTKVVLEATDDLGDPASWAPAGGTEVTVGAERVHYEPNTPLHETRYYRLRAQP